MNRIIFSFGRTSALILSAVLFLVGCQGETGPQGPTGPRGAPFSRAASYCNGVFTSANSGNGWTLTASCNAVADIPIEGWCFEPAGLPTTAFRSDDAPVNWNDAAQVAGWSCTWGWQEGATTSPIPAKVEICCATPQ